MLGAKIRRKMVPKKMESLSILQKNGQEMKTVHGRDVSGPDI